MLDVPLDEAGERQANEVAAYLCEQVGLGGERLAGVYASPLRRTRQTAAPFAARAGMAVQDAPGLLDIDVGDWQGRLVTEVQEREPELFAQWSSCPREFVFPGGEGLAAVWRRVVGFCDGLRAAHGDQDVVLVTHQVPAKLLVLAAIGADLGCFWRLRVDNAAVSLIVDEGQGPVATMFNATGHLSML